MRAPDPAALLCETCGYPLDGLPPAGVCPECATPIARSMPDARPGSPWQQRAGVGSLLATWWLLVIRPRSAWKRIAIRARPAASLLLLTVACAALLPALATATPTLKFGRPSWWAYPVAFFAVTWFVTLALTSIEFTGIRFFGRQRGWRITPTVALVICAHASVGWLLGGGAMGAAWLIGANTPRLNDTVLWAVVLTPYLGGMCLFSLLAGAGFHELRFVNDPGAMARRSAAGAESVEQSSAPAGAPGADPS